MSENPSDYPYYFAWELPKQGFEWRTDIKSESIKVSKDNPVLVEKSNIKKDKKGGLVLLASEVIHYHPLHINPTLYKDFVKLWKPTKDKILEFANKYGMLGIGQQISVKDDPFASFFAGPVIGESFDAWSKEISEMHALYILIKFFDAAEPEQDALPFIQEINRKLSEQPFRLALYFDKKKGKTKGFYTPTTLLSAMYLQLFWRITGEKMPKFCKCGCGRFWDSASSYSNREFFDKACEMRYRRKSKKGD